MLVIGLIKPATPGLLGGVAKFFADAEAPQLKSTNFQGEKRPRETVSGGTDSYARRINDRGQVIGLSATPSGESHAFFWEAGRMDDLGTLGDGTGWWPGSVAWGLNKRGLVVGFSDTASDETHAFTWRGGMMVDLGLLPGATRSLAWAVNDRGQIGETHRGDFTFHAFVWQDGTMIDLGTLPGAHFSSASAINEHGAILGMSGTAGGSVHAVLWTKR